MDEIVKWRQMDRIVSLVSKEFRKQKKERLIKCYDVVAFGLDDQICN